MQNRYLIKIFNLTAKKKIIWAAAETKTINCNRFEGESLTHDFVIMDMKDNTLSFVGYKEKGAEDFIIIKADAKDVEMFIKIIKATKIKKKEKVLV